VTTAVPPRPGAPVDRAVSAVLIVLAAAAVAGAALWAGGVTASGQTALAGCGVVLGAVAVGLCAARRRAPRLGAGAACFLGLAGFAALTAAPWPRGVAAVVAPYAVASREAGLGAEGGVRWSLESGETWRWTLLLAGLAFLSHAVTTAATSAGRGVLLLRALTLVLLGHALLGMAAGRYWDRDRVLGAFEVQNPYTAFGSFPNQSQYGAFAVVLLGAPLALWRLRRDPFDRGLAGATVLAAAAAVLRSESRAALAGFALALVVAWVLAADPGRRARRAAVAGAAVALVVAARLAGFEPLVRATPERLEEGLRFEVWRGTVDLASRQPVVGTGFGSFPYAYPGDGRPDRGLWVTIGENELLHTAAEVGIVGGALLLAGLCAAFAGFRRRVAASAAALGRPRRAPWVALAGLAGLLPSIATSTPLHTPAVLAAAVVVFGAASAIAGPDDPVRSH
jgi:O-antigen ligase